MLYKYISFESRAAERLQISFFKPTFIWIFCRILLSKNTFLLFFYFLNQTDSNYAFNFYLSQIQSSHRKACWENSIALGCFEVKSLHIPYFFLSYLFCEIDPKL